jgi:hypothetical protein
MLPGLILTYREFFNNVAIGHKKTFNEISDYSGLKKRIIRREELLLKYKKGDVNIYINGEIVY